MIMNKPLYIFFSILLFVIICPLVNGLIIVAFEPSSEDFGLIMALVYIFTAVPSLLLGLCYGILSPKFSTLKRFMLMVPCSFAIYLVCLNILSELIFYGIKATFFHSILLSLISILGTLFATLIAILMLKRKTD
ncbi:hypothetical protein [Zophobihabitans entericus]|uniref:Uncharacterized protein n=1 Tax=Zophobihabitans entericus TaxID=1635327 RepID=A0A6G9IDF4_9GAMM|nr:hypothetical protein [Zophobihabitans entericus]QIQ21852.1 hypothetical protein IPMB12_09270 [Zophobihabitans entericus]